MWSEAIHNQKFKTQFIIVVVLLVAFMLSVPWFFNHVINPKPGILLNDFVLNLFPPADHSAIIFTLIYGAIGISLFTLVQKPNQLLIILTAYCLMNYLRAWAMWLLTLEPPAGIIPLADPLLEKFIYHNSTMMKDLFFSGHAATLSILAAAEENKKMKILKWIVTVSVGLLLMHQRVHYTIDVIAGITISIALVKIIQASQR